MSDYHLVREVLSGMLDARPQADSPKEAIAALDRMEATMQALDAEVRTAQDERDDEIRIRGELEVLAGQVAGIHDGCCGQATKPEYACIHDRARSILAGG